ncbi:DUF262 domain-containing protein [bacterium]|nr:DUF262 domain-containing protein [bacterium]
MSKENFVPNTESFLSIIDNSNKYCVPKYQRDYSWDNQNEEWDLLWDDIVSDESKHYVGILVLQDVGNEINIIDGQQRLTTLTLVILAALYLMQKCILKIKDESQQSNARKQLSILMSKYIGKQEEDLKYYNKISLNTNNNEFFRNLCNIEANISIDNFSKNVKKKETKTNVTLLKSLKFFYDKIKNHILNPTPDKIIDFIKNKVANKLIFTTITVDGEENAYMLFETLNSRSVELSAYDLLKNHFLSVAGSQYEKSMLDELKAINDNIENDNITKFIALDWNSKNVPKIMEKRIYRKISKTYNDVKDVFSYVSSLKKSSEIYNIIKNHDYSDDKEVEEILKVLTYVPRIKQHYMILLSLFRTRDRYSIKSVAECLLKLAIRYNYVCQRQANKQETIYNSVANKIYNKQYNKTIDIINELKQSDISDKSKNEPYSCLIGNQTIMTKSDNNSLSGKTYKEKCEFYAKHPYQIVNQINNEVWDEKTVQERSLELAKIADKIFSL